MKYKIYVLLIGYTSTNYSSETQKPTCGNKKEEFRKKLSPLLIPTFQELDQSTKPKKKKVKWYIEHQKPPTPESEQDSFGKKCCSTLLSLFKGNNKD